MEVKRYQAKPVIIEAVQINSLDYDGLCEIVQWCGGVAKDNDDPGMGDKVVLVIPTLEGVSLQANDGDYIVRDHTGAFYSVKSGFFETKYEPVNAN